MSSKGVSSVLLTKERLREMRQHEKRLPDPRIIECLDHIDALEAENQKLREDWYHAEPLKGFRESFDAMEKERDAAIRELQILKDPSDGRCMEISALRLAIDSSHKVNEKLIEE